MIEADICTLCKGSGVCVVCGGEGELYDTPIAIEYGVPEECPRCGGNGECNPCYGLGHIPIVFQEQPD